MHRQTHSPHPLRRPHHQTICYIEHQQPMVGLKCHRSEDKLPAESLGPQIGQKCDSSSLCDDSQLKYLSFIIDAVVFMRLGRAQIVLYKE